MTQRVTVPHWPEPFSRTSPQRARLVGLGAGAPASKLIKAAPLRSAAARRQRRSALKARRRTPGQHAQQVT